MHLVQEPCPSADLVLPTEKMMPVPPPAIGNATSERTYPWHECDDVYGIQHELQNFDICLPRPLKESSNEDTVWVIFIHGGAWRDPSQDKSELQPALTQLLSTPKSHTLNHIAGFASINYGLSTYAPDDDAHDPSLRVTHPHHIADVVLALSYLHQKYKVGAARDSGGYDFVLVGHSAGATLAFQTLTHKCDCVVYRPVRAIVGLAGIYDLPLLVANHVEEPFYRKLVVDAFGEDEVVWRDASPALRKFEEARAMGGLEVAILGASEGDTLVEKEQWEGMRTNLEEQGWKSVQGNSAVSGTNENKKEIVFLPLEGTHDQIWELGDGVRKAIDLTVARLFPPIS